MLIGKIKIEIAGNMEKRLVNAYCLRVVKVGE